jgi:sortase A
MGMEIPFPSPSFGINIMPYRSFENEVSEGEIRLLLWRKLHSSRQERLERYRKTGRLVLLAPDIVSPAMSNFHTVSLSDDEQRLLRPGRPLADRFLFLIELSAVLGFAIVFLVGFSTLRALNRETALAFELPTLTPTPLIRAVVIPSGHTPPTSPGGTRPNVAEIPPQLRPLVQAYARLPVPTQGLENGVRIRIPAIDIDAPIVQGDGWEQLKKGVAQHPGTADPGRPGNLVLSGHNDVFGEVFRYLDRLKPGDEITVFTQQRSYTYIVSGWELVEPMQIDVMDPTPNPTITLISCYPYLIDTQRIIVKGQLAS